MCHFTQRLINHEKGIEHINVYTLKYNVVVAVKSYLKETGVLPIIPRCACHSVSIDCQCPATLYWRLLL